TQSANRLLTTGVLQLKNFRVPVFFFSSFCGKESEGSAPFRINRRVVKKENRKLDRETHRSSKEKTTFRPVNKNNKNNDEIPVLCRRIRLSSASASSTTRLSPTPRQGCKGWMETMFKLRRRNKQLLQQRRRVPWFSPGRSVTTASWPCAARSPPHERRPPQKQRPRALRGTSCLTHKMVESKPELCTVNNQLHLNEYLQYYYYFYFFYFIFSFLVLFGHFWSTWCQRRYTQYMSSLHIWMEPTIYFSY
ncbi:hypothetical protein COCON_G00018560, partial [Conger conger]